MVALGGRGGGCVVAWGVWLLWGGHVWLLPGGHAWLLRGGACVVAPGGGPVWLLRGEGAWDTTRYGDTVNERTVRILLECILVYI